MYCVVLDIAQGQDTSYYTSLPLPQGYQIKASKGPQGEDAVSSADVQVVVQDTEYDLQFGGLVAAT